MYTHPPSSHQRTFTLAEYQIVRIQRSTEDSYVPRHYVCIAEGHGLIRQAFMVITAQWFAASNRRYHDPRSSVHHSGFHLVAKQRISGLTAGRPFWASVPVPAACRSGNGDHVVRLNSHGDVAYAGLAWRCNCSVGHAFALRRVRLAARALLCKNPRHVSRTLLPAVDKQDNFCPMPVVL